jgi:hypothetical protein
MRSKPVSESSPATGATDGAADADAAAGAATSTAVDDPADATPDDAATDAARPRSGKPMRPTQIELEVSRQRAIGWTIFGLILGGLLIRSLGTVGVWAGIALVATGLYHAWQLVRTMLYPPGTIAVSDREVSLPRGLCAPRPVVVAPSAITAVYFLRRSVPWNRTAPVLVVEIDGRAMLFPRDWFASEADQRHVIHAVLRAKGETPSIGKPGSAGEPDAA